jgi:hypothetical protein
LEENLCREGTEDRVVEHSVELCQVGIEQLQVCVKGFCFESEEKGVKKTHHRVTEYYVSLARSAWSKCKECTEPIIIQIIGEFLENQIY